MRQEVLNWWKQAQYDLSSAEDNFKIKRFNVAAFLCQQAAEKALKAVYIKKFGELLKTHDLVLLGKKVELPNDLIDCCKSLTPAYVYTRYPDTEKINEIAEVSKELINKAKKVLEWVKKTL